VAQVRERFLQTKLSVTPTRLLFGGPVAQIRAFS